jgi:hypothetical protein
MLFFFGVSWQKNSYIDSHFVHAFVFASSSLNHGAFKGSVRKENKLIIRTGINSHFLKFTFIHKTYSQM